MRLIDADAVIEEYNASSGTISDLMEAILNSETIDEVRHGKWVNEDFHERIATVRDMAQCSVCGELSHKAGHGYAILSKFCPHCGARMDLK